MKKRFIYVLVAGIMAGHCALAASSGECLQQALYAEQIEGDLPAAIAHYQTIIDDFGASANHIAQALYHQGVCYKQLEQDAQAMAVLSRLCADYADQTELVAKARPVLESIQLFDPAALMPPETLAYLELGSTGKQLETVLEMLKGTPLEDPLLAISQMDPDALREGPGPLIAGLLNPAMEEEFKKIRGLAVGLVDITQDAPSVVAVMHLGESSMLRGLLMTGLSIAARPGPVIEGVQTYSIEGNVEIACDGQVFLVSAPGGRLPWMIRQYKQSFNDASLASDNPSFSKLDKAVRQENLATLWVNTDDVYARLVQQVDDMGIIMAGGVANVASMDDLMLTVSLAAETISLDGRLRFKDGMQNMIYEMIKTPSICCAGMNGVPENAIGVLTFDLADSKSMQASQLRQLALTNLGVDLSAELIDSIQQITLFALPYDDQELHDMPIRPGLVIQCSNQEPWMEFMQAMKPMLEEQGLAFQVANGAVVLARDLDVIHAVSESLNGASSVADSGRLSAVLKQLTDSSQKLGVVSVGGAVRLANAGRQYPQDGVSEELKQRVEDGFENLGSALDGTTISLYSEELSSEFVLRARLDGIPSIGTLIAEIGALQEAVADVERVWAEEQAAMQAERLSELMTQPSARIVKTETAPVIDGEFDEIWNSAVKNDLGKTIYVNPGPDSQLAANYRMLWDARNLYILIDVIDSSPMTSQTWQFNDGIELYLDASGSRPAYFGDLQYQFGLLWNTNPAAAICVQQHGRSVHAIQTGLKNTETGYRFEFAFPWSEFGAVPAEGTRIGVEVQVNDNRGHGVRDAKISWHDPDDMAWRNPQYFGSAELVHAAK